MSTRIRLRRMGANKRPFYRVVVADQRSPRDGRFIENIGKYHPLEDPSLIEINEERALHWLRVGAQPSDQVRTLMTRVGIWEKFLEERPSAAVAQKPRMDKAEKEAAKAAKAAAAAKEAAASQAAAEAAAAAAAAEAAAAQAESASEEAAAADESAETAEATESAEPAEAQAETEAPEAAEAAESSESTEE